jgi:hypothetical protein
MSNILLLGAGFSRNWNGFLAKEVFDYLLGCPEISCNQYLKELLFRNQTNGGFESALAAVQADYLNNSGTSTNNLIDFQSAVIQMFNHMNDGFFKMSFEFQQSLEMSIGRFLARFDRIFTLNQDLLLEHHYIDNNVALLSNTRWNGSELPGMRPIQSCNGISSSWAQRIWVPVDKKEFKLCAERQPYIKLHGSSNWQWGENQKNLMLIMGGNKINEIELSPVLSWYQQLFRDSLSQAKARLMVIGYGFQDVHINDIIRSAINKHHLQMFIIAPSGSDRLENDFKNSIIGVSRRSLDEIFGKDIIEHKKVMRFFER